jgi:hypothetical protein
VVLIAKKEGAQRIGDYRPISVMHNIMKLLGKILTNRLAPHLDSIISNSQSTFIRDRSSIHDNFQYVQGAIKHFHRSKTPMLFVKLDAAKTFDNVRWEYLLELLGHIGFGQRWRDIHALLWSSTSSTILLNGQAGRLIKHGRGLRQGDPLAPMPPWTLCSDFWIRPFRRGCYIRSAQARSACAPACTPTTWLSLSGLL